MPIYDYRCDHCGHAFSAVQSFSDAPVEKCPNCGKQPRRLIVPPAIVFKGSGWYKTDSRPAPKEGDGASPKSEDKKDTKKETKTDTAAPSTSASEKSERAS